MKRELYLRRKYWKEDNRYCSFMLLHTIRFIFVVMMMIITTTTTMGMMMMMVLMLMKMIIITVRGHY